MTNMRLRRSSSSPTCLGAAVVFGSAVVACNPMFGVDELRYDRTSAAPDGGDGGSTTSTGGRGGEGGALGGGGAGGSGGSQGGAGGGMVPCTGVHTYVPIVADCIELPDPDPDACETVSGAGSMLITTSASTTHNPFHSFVRFDIEPDVAQSPLVSATLRVVVSNMAYADSPESGEIWRVAPFTRSELFSGEPADVGTQPLAASLGAVTQGQTVEWALPPSGIFDFSSVYLRIRPLVTDSARYDNLNGTTPPELILTCP